MADTLSEHKEGGDDGKSNTVVPLRDESFRLQCDPSGEHSQDPQAQEETKLHSSELQQGKCESIRLPLIETKDAKSCEEATNKHGELTDEDEREAGASSKRQEDERGLDIDESKVTKINLSQAKDPPEGENSQAEEKKLMMEHSESSPQTGALCETLSVNITSESPPALNDSSTCEPSPPSPSPLPAHALKKSDIYSENGSSSVDGCQESSESLSKAILPSTGIQPDTDLDSSSIVSNDQEKLIEVTAESQVLSKRSLHIAPSETVGNELDSTQLSSGSSASDLYSSKEVQHNVDDSPSQSSQLSFTTTETDTTHQESGDKMAIAISVNLSQDKETEPHSQVGNTYSPQSAENVSLEKSIVKNVDTEGNESLIENEVAGNPENRAAQSETELEKLESSNNPNSVSEMTTEILPQIVATRSLSQDQGIENESTYKERPTEPAALEMEATKVRIVPSLEPEPLKPVTIGSSLQPLEEVQEASIVEEASFSTDMAIIDSSADEADSIGGLVINNVIGAADGVADFQPDEVETERELTDISASAPQLDEGSDSGDEHGPSAKRRKLENEPNIGTEKLNSAKKVILRVIPVKNGHGVWDSQKLQEVLLSKGTILLQIHASKESMEMFEPDKNDEKVDFTAIMGEAKDEGHSHVLSFGNVEPDYDDPLSVSTSLRDTTSPPTFSRPFSHPHSRSTALQPAMSRPGFKHLQTPQQYHMKNEVFGLPPPLEFEEPQMNPSDWSGMDAHSVAFSESQASPHSPVEVNLVPHSSGPQSKVSRVKVCPECGKQFTKAHRYKVHILFHKPLLNCGMCSYKTRHPEMLKMHELKHEIVEAENKCNICCKYYRSDQTLREHQRRIHSIFICKYCDDMYKTEEEFRTHMDDRYCHRRKVKRYLMPNNPQQLKLKTTDGRQDQLTCQFCSKNFQHKQDLEIHLAQHLVTSSKEKSDNMEINQESNSGMKSEINFETPLPPEDAIYPVTECEIVKHEIDSADKEQELLPACHLLAQPPQSHNRILLISNPSRIEPEQIRLSSFRCTRSELTKPKVIPAFWDTSLHQPSRVSSIPLGKTLFISNSVGQPLPMMKQGILKQLPILNNTNKQNASSYPCVTSTAYDTSEVTPSASILDNVQINCLKTSQELQEKDIECNLCVLCSSIFPTRDDLKNHYCDEHLNFPNVKALSHTQTKKAAVCKTSVNKKSKKKAKTKISVKKKSKKEAKTKTSVNKKFQMKFPFPCNVCNEAFTSKKELKIHEKSHLYRKYFTCSACRVVYKSASRLLQHQRICHRDKHLCRFGCGKLYATEVGIFRHYKKSHEKDYSREKCPYCQKSFVYRACLKNHLGKCKDRRLNERPNGCGNCDDFFLKIKAYNEHVKLCPPFFKKRDLNKNTDEEAAREAIGSSSPKNTDEEAAREVIGSSSQNISEIRIGGLENWEDTFNDSNPNCRNESPVENLSGNLPNGFRHRRPTLTTACGNCRYCSNIIIGKSKRVKHILSQHKSLVNSMICSFHKCEICGMIFKTSNILCRHLLKHHTESNMLDALVPRDILKLVFLRNYCWICKCTYEWPGDIEHGIERDIIIDKAFTSQEVGKAVVEPLQCEECNHTFSTLKEFWGHVHDHISTLPRISSNTKRIAATQYLECSECQYKCKEIDEFYEHITCHFIQENENIEVHEDFSEKPMNNEADIDEGVDKAE